MSGRRELPGSVASAVWCLLALVVVSAIAVLLTWLQEDAVILSWAKGNASAQEMLASGGIAALREADDLVPKFVPLVLVSFIVFLVLVVVLGAFLLDGHGWSRPVLTGLCGFGLLVAALGLGQGLPVAFTVLSGLFLLLCVALVFFLWRKDTSSYLRVS